MLRQLIEADELGRVLFAIMIVLGMIISGIIVHRHLEQGHELAKIKAMSIYAGDRNAD